jgi:hypothetical protein
LALARAKLLVSAGFARLIIIPQRVVRQTLVGKDRSPLTSSYSPKCVEVEFCEVRLAASAAPRLVIESIKNYTSLDEFPDRTRR